MEATKNIELEIPLAISEALDGVVERTGRSRADLIQDAIRSFLLEKEQTTADPTWPRSVGAGFDPELSGADSEDWLLANWRPEADWGRS